MYYAVFYQSTDDSGDCTVENAAHDVLTQELGKGGFAGGQDNGITCDCVDDVSKVPALKKAWPGQEIIEMTPRNFKLWAMSFGEFDPDDDGDGIEGWYENAKQ
jgi:hypothetical protein